MRIRRCFLVMTLVTFYTVMMVTKGSYTHLSSVRLVNATVRTVDVCSQPIIRGPCLQRIIRYAYNVGRNRCRKFTYSGCGGNENRFSRRSECRKRCVKQKRRALPNKAVVRVRPRNDEYRSKLLRKDCNDECDKQYGICANGQCICANGFTGNGKHCEDLDECATDGRCAENSYCVNTVGSYKCECLLGFAGSGNNCTRSSEVCKQKFDKRYERRCKGNAQWEVRFFYDHNSKSCERFWYGGCVYSNSQNIFTDLKVCNALCVDPLNASQRKYTVHMENSETEVTAVALPTDLAPETNLIDDLTADHSHADAICLEPFNLTLLNPCGSRLWHPRYFYNSSSARCQFFWFDESCPPSSNARNIFGHMSACKTLCETMRMDRIQNAVGTGGRTHSILGEYDNSNTGLSLLGENLIEYDEDRYRLTPQTTIKVKATLKSKNPESSSTNYVVPRRNFGERMRLQTQTRRTPALMRNYKNKVHGYIAVTKSVFNRQQNSHEKLRKAKYHHGIVNLNTKEKSTLLEQPHSNLVDFLHRQHSYHRQNISVDNRSYGRKSWKPKILTSLKHSVSRRPQYEMRMDMHNDEPLKYASQYDQFEGDSDQHTRVTAVHRIRSTTDYFSPSTKSEQIRHQSLIRISDECLDPFDDKLIRSCGKEVWKPRYFFNFDSKKCEVFWNDGCRSLSRNNFADIATCQWKCETTHPDPQSLSCLDAFDPTYLRDCNHGRYEKRYFFNAERKRCEVFYYGGCTSASKNIFEDYDACRNLCENPDKHLTRICEQPFQAESDDECSEDGRRVQRYYYNQKKNHCEMFWSRNCRRNSENVFTSLATCKWLCERENDGLLPKDCLDRFDKIYMESCDGGKWRRKWYFDQENGRCRSFWYDGCLSESQNIFNDGETCRWLCELPSEYSIPYMVPYKGRPHLRPFFSLELQRGVRNPDIWVRK